MGKEINKIILAYSGGLDTSVILHWLKEQYSADVIAFTADIGQEHNSKEVESRAKEIGASKVFIEDLKHEFISEYVFPMFRANAVYEGEYLLGTSIAFQLLAIFLAYNAAGTLEFSKHGIFNGNGEGDAFLIITFILFMAGITKAALMLSLIHI